jgi:uracil-DNA glycosylase family 4
MVKCRPPENRKPTKDELDACRPFLEEQIRLLSPLLIVTAGNTPTQWFLNTRKGVTALRGQ